MINNLLTEAKNYVSSREYYASMESIARQFQLNEDEGGMLIGRVNAFFIGQIEEKNLLGEIVSELEINEEKAKDIENKIKKDIIIPFKQKLSTLLTTSPVLNTQKDEHVASINTLRQAAPLPQPPQPQHTQPTPDQNPTKASLLSEIESPQRTVIKKYVIEHEPITDPEHIIDDTIDTRPRLEQ